MSLSKVLSKFRPSSVSVLKEEWRLTATDVRHWCSIVSLQGKESLRIVKNHLSENGLYVGSNTFEDGFLLVLHRACTSGSVKLIQYILDSHVDQFNINQLVLHHPVPSCYFTPEDEMRIDERLSHAKTTLLHAAVNGGSIQIMKLLVENGASVDIPDCCSKTPLIKALEYVHIDAVMYLLKVGADVNYQDIDGRTPLMYAAKLSYPLEFLSTLLKAGADPATPNHIGHTVVHDVILNNSTALESLFLLNISPLTRPQMSAPFALFLTDQNNFMKNSYSVRYKDQITSPITTHPDCPSEHKVDDLLLSGTYHFYLHYKSSNQSQYLWYFLTALELRRSLGLTPPSVPQIEAYQWHTEIQSLDELEKYSNIDDRKIYLAFQCLIIRERCLGYGDITLIKCLFVFGKWMKDLNGLSLVLRGSKMLLSNLKRGITSQLHLLQYLVNIGIENCYYILQSDFKVYNIKIMSKETREVIYMPILRNLIECQALCIDFGKRIHSHEITDIQFEKGINRLLDIVSFLHAHPVEGIDVEILGRDLVLKCSKFISTAGWPSNVLDAQVRSGKHDVDFLRALLEWGAADYINLPGNFGYRPIHRSRKEEVEQVLIEYGAHIDVSSKYEICPYPVEIPLPQPLACLAAKVIVHDSIIPYKSLDLPPRMKKFISLHDPEENEYNIKDEIGSLI